MSASALLLCCTSRILNITFMYHPVLGAPKSNIREYLGDWKNRHWAIIAGVICGLGNTLQFMGGQVPHPFLHARMLQLAASPRKYLSHTKHIEQASLNRVYLTAYCTGGRLCGCGQCASTPPGQHHLGSVAFWRVLQVGPAVCPSDSGNLAVHDTCIWHVISSPSTLHRLSC